VDQDKVRADSRGLRWASRLQALLQSCMLLPEAPAEPALLRAVDISLRNSVYTATNPLNVR
jgi:hypothetical protein